MKKTALHEKLLFEEELDDLDIDDIGNFEDLSRLVFIDEECGIPEFLLMMESLIEILT